MSNWKSTEEIAAALSNFNGFDEEALAGDGNVLLDFNSFKGDNRRVNFKNEMESDRSYRFAIQNSNSAQEGARIIPGFNPSNNHLMATGNFSSVGGNGLVLVGTDPQPIELFQKQIDSNPIKCLGLKVESDSILIRSAKLEIVEYDAFSPAPKRTVINFADYTDEYVQQEKTITVRKSFYMNKRTEVILWVPKCLVDGAEVPAPIAAIPSTTTITMWFGASIDLGAALPKLNSIAAPIVEKGK